MFNMSRKAEETGKGSQHPGRKRETIQADGEWLTREQIAGRIQEMMAAGNTNIRGLADSLDELDARLMVRAENNLASLREIFGVNRDIIDDSEAVESLISNAEGSRDRKEYEESLDACYRASGMIEEARENHYGGKTKSLIDEAKRMLDERGDTDIDVTGTDALLGKARELLDRREYEEALELARSTNGLIAASRRKHQRSIAMKLLGEAKAMLNRAEDLGLDVEEWGTNLSQAEKAFAEEDHEGAGRVLHELKKGVEKDIDRHLADELKGALNSFRALMAGAEEMGMDLSEEKGAGAEIEETIRTRGYGDALGTVAGMIRKLEFRLAAQRRRDATKKLRDLTRELAAFQREEGKEFPELRQILDKAFDALENEDPDRVDEDFSEFLEIKKGIEQRLELDSLSREMEEKEGILQTLKDVGVDVTEAARDLEAARSAVAEGDAEGAGECLHAFDETFENLRGKDVKKLAYTRMKSVKKLLLATKKHGANISDQKEQMIEALAAIEGDDFLKGYNIAISMERTLTERLGTKKREEVENVLAEVEEMIRKAQQLWLDVSGPQEDLEAARESLEDDELDRARELADKAEKDVKDVLVEKEVEIYEFKADEITNLLLEGEKLGLDLTKEKDEKEEAERLSGAGEYSRAAEALKELKTIIADRIKTTRTDVYEQKFVKTEDALASLEKDTGRHYEDLEELLDAASAAMDEREYDGMDEKLEEFHNKLNDRTREHLNTKYGTEIHVIEELLERVKTLGIDTGTATELTARARDTLESGDIDTTGEELSALHEAVEEIKGEKAKKRAKEISTELNEMFKRLKVAGMDLETEEELFRQIVEAIKAKDFIKACSLADKSMKILMKRDQRKHLSDVEMEAENARELVSELREVERFPPALLGKLGELVDGMTNLLKDEDTTAAEELAREWIGMEPALGKARELAGKVTALEKEVEKKIKTAREAGLDIEDEDAVLSEVEELLEEHSLKDALRGLAEIGESISSKLELLSRDQASEAMTEAEEALKDADVAEEEREEFEGRLGKVRSLMEEGAYEESREEAARISTAIEEREESRAQEAIRDLLSSSKKLMDEVKEKGGDSARAEALYYRSTYFLEKKDMEGAREYAKRCLDRAMNARMALDRDAASGLVERIRELRDKAAGEELDTSGIDEIIERAEGHAREGNMKENAGLLAMAEEEYFRADANMAGDRARGLLEEAGRLWLETDEATGLLEEAEQALDDGEIDNARDRTAVATRLLEEMIAKGYREKGGNLAGKLSKEVGRARELGIDVTADKNRFKEAAAFKNEGRYREAAELLGVLFSSLAGRCDERELAAAGEDLTALSGSTGKEYDDLDALLETARIVRGKEDHKGFSHVMDDFYRKYEGYEEENDRTRFAEVIKEARELTERVGPMGIDTGNVPELLENAGRALKEGKLGEADEHVASLRREMDDISGPRAEKRVKEITRDLNALFRMLKSAGLELDTEKELFNQIVEAIKSKDYLRACTLSMNSMKILTKRDRRRHLSEVEVEAERASELLSVLEGVRRFPPDMLDRLKELAERMVRKLEEKDPAGAEELAREFRELEPELADVRALAEEVGSAEKETAELRERAEAAGLDVEDEEDMLDEAEKLMDGYELEEAGSVLAEADGSIRSKLELHMRDGAQEALTAAADALAEVDATERREELAERLGGAETLFSQEAYEKCREEASDIMLTIKESREERKETAIRELLNSSQGLMEETGRMKGDTARAEALYYRSTYFLEKKELSRAREFAKQCLEEAREARNSLDRNSAARKVRRIAKLREKAEEAGLDPEGIIKVIHEAEGLAQEGKVEEIDALISKAEQEYSLAGARGVITKARELLDEAGKLWLDTDGPAAGIERAERAIEEGDAQGAEREAAAASETLSELVKDAYREKGENIAKKITPLARQAKELGVDITQDKKRFPEVVALKNEGRFREAAAILQELSVSLEEKCGLKKLANARSELEELETHAGREFEDLREYLGSAEKALGKRDHKGTKASLSKFSEVIEGHTLEHSSEEYSRELGEISKMISEYGSAGVDTGKEAERLNGIREAVAGKRMDEAGEMLGELRGQVEDGLKARVKELAWERESAVEERMESLIARGVDVSGGKRFLRDAKRASRQGDHVKGIILYGEAMALFEGQLKEQAADELRTELNAAEDYLEELEAAEHVPDRTYDGLRGLLDDAGNALDEDELEETRKILGEYRVRETEVRETVNRLEDVDKALDELDSLIQEASALGMDTSDAKDGIGDIEEMMAELDTETALEMAGKIADRIKSGMDNKKKNEAEGLLHEAEELLGEHVDALADHEALCARLDEVRNLSEACEHGQAAELAGAIIKAIGEGKEQTRKQQIDAALRDLENFIGEMEEAGADVSKAEALFYKAKYFTEKGDLDKAMRSVKESRERAVRAQKEFRLKQAERALEDLETEAGTEYNDLREMIARTRKGIEEGDLDSVEGLLAEFRQAKEEHYRSYLTDRYTVHAAGGEGALEHLADLGIPAESGGELIADLREAVEAGDFDKAEKMAQNMDALLSDLRSVKAKSLAKKVVGETNLLFSELKKMELDVSRERGIFKEVLISIKGRDYVRGIELTYEARDSLLAIRREHFKSSADAELGALSGNLDEGEELKLVIGELEDAYENGMDLYDDEKFEEALSVAREAAQLYEKIRTEHYREVSEAELDGVRELMAEAGELDMDTEDLERAGKSAEELFSGGSYEEALDRAEELRKELETAIEGQFREMAAERNDRLRELMADAEGLGLDTGDVQEKIGEASGLVEAGDLRGLVALLEGAIGDVTGGIDSELRERGERKLRDAREKLDALCKEAGKEYDDLEVLLDSAGEFMGSVEYDELDRVLTDLHSALNEHRLDHLCDKYTVTSDGMEEEMTDLESLGIEIDDCYEVLVAIRKGVAGRDLSTMEEHVASLDDLLEEARTVKARTIAKSHFVAAKDLQAELKGAGEEIGREMAVFKKAVMTIKNKDFVEGIRLTREAEELMRAARERYRKGMAAEAMEGVEATIAEAERIGLGSGTVIELQKSLEAMAGQMNEGRFLECLADAGSANDLYDRERTAHFKRKAEVELDEVADRTAEGDDIGLDMDEVAKSLQQAEEAFDDGDYERTLEILKEADATFTELRTEHFRKRAEGLLDELGDKAARGREMALDMDGVEGDLEVARELFSGEAYEDAIERARNAIEDHSAIMSEYHRESADSTLEIIKEIMTEAGEFEVDTAFIREGIAEVRSLYGNERYAEAHSASGTARDELRERVDARQLEILAEKVSGIEEALSRAEDIEAEAAGDREKLRSLIELRNEGELREAIALAPALLDNINENIDKRVHEVNEGKAEAAEERLVDLQAETTKTYEKLWEVLDDGREALETREYGRLDEILTTFEEKLEVERDLYLAESFDERLGAAEAEAGELAKLGLPVQRVMGTIEAARECVDEKNWTGAREAADDVDTALDEVRTTEARALAKTHFVKAKGLIGELKELLPDCSEFEAAFRDVVTAIKEKDFVRACSVLTSSLEAMEKARESHFRERSERGFEELRTLIPAASELSIPLEGLNDEFADAKRRYDESDFEGAAEVVELCLSRIRGDMESTRLVIISERDARLEKHMEEAAEIDANIAEETEGIARAREMREAGELEGAMELLSGLIASTIGKTETRRREIAEGRLDDARNALRALSEESGCGYEDLEGALTEARAALEAGDHSSLYGILEKFEGSRKERHAEYLSIKYSGKADAAGTEMDTILDVGIELGPAPGLLDEVRTHIDDGEFIDAREALGKINEMLEQARNVDAKGIAKREFTTTNRLLMRLKKEGIDLSEEEKAFRNILSAIKGRDYVKSIRLTKDVNLMLADARKSHSRKNATLAIESLEGMLGEAGSIFKDTAFLDRLHRKAMDNYDEEKFDDAMELVGKAREEFEEKRREFQREMAEGTLERLGDVMERCAALGMDVTTYGKEDEKARSLYDDGDFERAEEMAGKAVSEAEKAFEDRQLLIIIERTEGIEPLLRLAGELSVDTAPEKGRMMAADEMLEEKRYGESMELLAEIITTLESKIEESRKELYGERIEEARKELRALGEETGESYADLEEKLGGLSDAVERRDWDAAAARVTEFGDLTNMHRNAFLRDRYDGIANVFEGQITELEDVGVGMGEALPIMEHLRSVIGGNNFEAAKEAATSLGEMVNEANTRRARELAKERFLEAKELITYMRKTGADPGGGDVSFTEAVTAIKARDFIGGIRASLRARELLSRARGRYYIDSAGKELAGLTGTTGESYSDLGEIIDTMDTALEEEDYETLASQLAMFREAKREYEDEHRAGECLAELNSLEGEMAELSELGIEIPDQDVALNEAGEYLDSHDFDGYAEAAERFRGLLETARTVTARDIASRMMMETREIYGELSKEGLDMSEDEEKFKGVVGSVKAKEFVAAIEAISSAREALIEKRTQHRKNLATEALMNVENLLSGMTHLEVDTAGAAEKLSEARALFEEGRYGEVMETASTAERAALDARENFLRRTTIIALEETDTEIRQGAEEGVETGAMEEEVARAFMLIEERRYDEAEECRKRAEEMLSEAIEALKQARVRKAMEDAEALVESAASLGLDAASVETQLEYARIHIEDGEFDDARELLEQASSVMRESIGDKRRQTVEANLAELEPMLGMARDLEADISDELDALSSLRALLDTNSYDEARKLIEDVGKALGSKIEGARWAEGTRRITTSRDGLVRFSRETGTPTEEMEFILVEAEEAINEGDYEGFEEKLGAFEAALAAESRGVAARKSADRAAELRREAERVGAAGIEAAELMELVEKGRAAADAGDPEAAGELLDRADEALTEAGSVTAKALVKKYIGEARELFTGLKSLGYELEEENRLFTKVREAVSGQDFLEACRLLQKVRKSLRAAMDEHRRTKAGEALEGFSALVAEGANMGLDVGEEKTLLAELTDALAGGMAEDVLGGAEAARTALSERISGKRGETLAEELSELEPFVEAARSLAIDIAGEEERLNTLTEMRVEGRLAEAVEVVRTVRGDVERKIDAYYVDTNAAKIGEARERLDELEKLTGKGHDDLRETLAGCAQALEEMRLDSVEEALELLGTQVEDRKRAFRTGILGERLDEAGAGIARIDEAGIDTSAAKELLEKVREALGAGDLEGADVETGRLEAEITGIRDEGAKKRAKDEFIAVKELVAEAKELELLSPDTDETFRQAVGSIRGRDFLEGIRLLSGVKGALGEQIKSYHKGETEKLLARISILIGEAESIGTDIDGTNTAFEKVKSDHEDKRHREAHSGAEEVLADLEEAMDHTRENVLVSRVEALVGRLGEARERGIDIKAEAERLADMEKLRSERRYGEAMEIVDSVDVVLDERMAENRRVLKEKKLAEARRTLEELEGLAGREYWDLRAELEEITQQFERGDYEVMDDSVAAFYLKREEYSSALLAGSYGPKLEGYASVLEDHSRLGLDTGVGEEILQEAWKAVDEKNFDRMPGITAQLDGFLEELTTVKAKDLAKSHLAESKSLIGRVRDAGLEPGSDNEIFGEVLENVRSRDFLGALRTSLSIRTGLEEMLAGHRRERTDRLITDTEAMTSEANGLGLDTATAGEQLEAVMAALETERAEDALGLAKKAHENLRTILDTHYSGEAGRLLTEAEPILERLVPEEIDTAIWAEGLSKARAYLSEGNMKIGALLAGETLNSLLLGEKDHFSRKAAGAIEGARCAIERCSGKGIDISFALEALESANADLEAGDLGEATRIATALREKLDEMEVQYLKKDTSALLSEIWNMTAEASGLELDISASEERVAMAQEFLGEGELEKGLELATAVRGEIKAALDGKYRIMLAEELEGFREDLARAGEMGAGTDEETERAGSVEQLKEAGRYSDALSMIKNGRKQLLLKIERGHRDRLEGALAESRGILEAIAEQTGGEPENLRELLEMGREAFEAGDTDSMAGYLSDFELAAAGLRSELANAGAEERLRVFTSELDEMEVLGLDVSTSRNIQTGGIGHARAGRLEEAEAAAGELERTLEHLRTEGAKELAKIRIQHVKKLFGEVRSAGVDTSEEEEIFKEMVGAVKAGDFKQALLYCQKASTSLDTKRSTHSADEMRVRMEEAAAVISVGGEMGLDPGEAEALLAEAREAFHAGDLPLAGEQLNAAEETFANARKEHFKKQAKESMKELRELMIDGMETEVDMVELEDLAANARRHYDRGDYENSQQCSEKAGELVLRARTDIAAGAASSGLERFVSILREATEAGIDVSAHAGTAEELKELIAGESYDEARERSTAAYTEVEGELTELRRGVFEQASGKLSELDDKARGIGMEITWPGETLKRAHNMFENGEFGAAVPLLEEAVERLAAEIETHRKAHETAEIRRAADAIAELEAETGGVAGLEFDLSEARRSLEAAREAMDRGDVQRMNALLSELHGIVDEKRKGLAVDVYPAVLDSLRDDIMALQGIGIPLALAEELLVSAGENLADGEMAPVRELRGQIEEIIRDARGEPAREMAKKRITEVRDSLRELKEQGVDISVEEKRFRGVGSLVKSGDFVGAAGLMAEIGEMLVKSKKKHYTGRIKETLAKVDEIVRKASGKGLEIKAARHKAFEARTLAKRKKYTKAVPLAEEALGMAMEVWEASLRESAATSLEEVTALVEEARGSFDVSGVEGILEAAERENAEGSFIACIEHAGEARKTLENIKTGKIERSARESLERVERLEAALAEAGMDASAIRQGLDSARETYEAGDTGAVPCRLETVENAFLTARSREFSAFLGEIEPLAYVTKERKTEFAEMSLTMSSHWDRGEMATAETLAIEMTILMGTTRAGNKLEEEYISLTAGAGELIDRAKENGIDVSVQEETLGEAVRMKEEGDPEGAISTLLGLHEGLVGTVGELLKERAEELMLETEDLLAGQGEVDTEELEGRLKDAGKRFEAGDYEGVIDGCGDIRNGLDELLNTKKTEYVEELLARARKELEKSKDVGLDIFDIEAYIFKASMAFQSGSLDETIGLAEKAIDSALTGREGIDEGKIRMTMRNTESLVFESSEFSIDMSEIEEGLEKAEKFLEERQLQSAKELSEKLYTEARELVDETLLDIIPEKFREISDLIEEAKGAGASVDEDEVALISIDTLKEEGRYLSAIKMITSVEAVVHEKLDARRGEQAREKLDGAFEDFNLFRETAISDYPELEELLDAALRAMTEGDTDTVAGNVEEFYRRKDQYERKTRTEELTAAVTMMAERLEPLEELKIDVSTGSELVESARGQLAVEDYGAVENTLREIDEFIVSVFSEKLRPDAEANVEEIDVMLGSLREKGVDVREEEKKFSDILTAIDEKDYVKAYDMSGRLKMMVAKVYNHRRKEMLDARIEGIEKFYRDFDEKGYFEGPYEEIISSAVEELREHHGRGEFDLCEEKLPILDETIATLREKMKEKLEASDLLSEANGFLDTAENLGVEFESDEKKVEKAEDLFDELEYGEAKALLKETLKSLKTNINKRRMSIAKMVLEDSLAVFNEYRGKVEKEVVAECQEMIKDATRNFKKGKFEAAIRIAEELKAKMTGGEMPEPEPPGAPGEEPEKPEEPPEDGEEETWDDEGDDEEEDREEGKEEVEKIAEPEEEEEKKKAGPAGKKVKLTCPKCKKAYAAMIVKVPAVVRCPFCKAKGVIRSI